MVLHRPLELAASTRHVTRNAYRARAFVDGHTCFAISVPCPTPPHCGQFVGKPEVRAEQRVVQEG